MGTELNHLERSKGIWSAAKQRSTVTIYNHYIRKKFSSFCHDIFLPKKNLKEKDAHERPTSPQKEKSCQS